MDFASSFPPTVQKWSQNVGSHLGLVISFGARVCILVIGEWSLSIDLSPLHHVLLTFGSFKRQIITKNQSLVMIKTYYWEKYFWYVHYKFLFRSMSYKIEGEDSIISTATYHKGMMLV